MKRSMVLFFMVLIMAVSGCAGMYDGPSPGWSDEKSTGAYGKGFALTASLIGAVGHDLSRMPETDIIKTVRYYALENAVNEKPMFYDTTIRRSGFATTDTVYRADVLSFDKATECAVVKVTKVGYKIKKSDTGEEIKVPLGEYHQRFRHPHEMCRVKNTTSRDINEIWKYVREVKVDETKK